ncbi:MAG: hypothetical protein ACRD5I_04955 [Candidatus Acidiferrales bacterium]
MVVLEMTDEQADVLETLLRRELSDLKVEIHRTDDWEFRETLKAKQGSLAECLERLEEALTRSTP